MLKLITRHRLLWKIILIFWLTTLCTIVANVYITREIAISEFKSEHFQRKTQLLAQDAVRVYEDDGYRALRKWYRHTLRHDGLKVVLLDKDENKVGGKYRKTFEARNDNLFQKQPPFKQHLLTLADQKVTSENGSVYTLRILPSPALSAKFNPETLHFYRLLASLVIIFIGSLWLYRSIAKPLKVLHDASLALSKGDFSVRTTHKVGSRKNELGQLAQAFDEMAIKIEALLNNQKQLFRDISHEIRTPLTRQKLAIELAKNSETPLVFLEKIEHQNNNINALVHNLLTFLQLEDSTPRNSETLDLAQIMLDLITEAELDIKAKHIDVHSEFEGQYLITGDNILITRALENILMNAIKYSPASGKVDIQMSRLNSMYQLSISDQGPGIPETDLEHVLKPFYRSDQSRNQQTGGFGLGLAITHKIIKQHKGELRINNVQPSGLRVSLEFPIDESIDK